MFLWLNMSFPKSFKLLKHEIWGKNIKQCSFYSCILDFCLPAGGCKLVFQFVCVVVVVRYNCDKMLCAGKKNTFSWCDKQKRQSDYDALKKASAINRKDVKRLWRPIILTAGSVFFAYSWSVFCISKFPDQNNCAETHTHTHLLLVTLCERQVGVAERSPTANREVNFSRHADSDYTFQAVLHD